MLEMLKKNKWLVDFNITSLIPHHFDEQKSFIGDRMVHIVFLDEIITFFTY